MPSRGGTTMPFFAAERLKNIAHGVSREVKEQISISPRGAKEWFPRNLI
jgi:hypothetical protein